MTHNVRCAVCGEEVRGDKLSIDYEGERYAFCCRYCRERFVEDCELQSIRSTFGSDDPGVQG
jgi:YHS domain-containing protein